MTHNKKAMNILAHMLIEMGYTANDDKFNKTLEKYSKKLTILISNQIADVIWEYRNKYKAWGGIATAEFIIDFCTFNKGIRRKL